MPQPFLRLKSLRVQCNTGYLVGSKVNKRFSALGILIREFVKRRKVLNLVEVYFELLRVKYLRVAVLVADGHSVAGTPSCSIALPPLVIAG
jgi:hypothetical protein